MHRVSVRASGGRLGTKFRGQPLILLTTTGRRTGKQRTWLLVALPAGDGWVVAASNGGHDQHPAWYLNLQASPEATVQIGRRTVPVRARDASDAERAEQWPRFVDTLSTYADYEDVTDRVIPVVLLEPVSSGTAEGGGH
jgi:deazaflavin-dependent oxidoreductase (nitroreductase family)